MSTTVNTQMQEKIKRYYLNLIYTQKRGVLAAFLYFMLHLCSFIYGWFGKITFLCYRDGLCRSFKPDCRVISVGNITWGGTGKTALTQNLALFFKQQSRQPAVLIRGYGQDEVYMLKEKLKGIPVLQGRNRIKSAKLACGDHAADVIILDDGFQHWPLKRDLDIVLIDANFPFGGGSLLPRGILRESLSALKRADVFVLTKIDSPGLPLESIKDTLRSYNRCAAIYQARYQPRYLYNFISGEKKELEKIKGEKIALVCGIANPYSFEKTLSSLSADIALRFYFSDHFQYRLSDWLNIQRQCSQHNINTVVTTEKDLPRLRRILRTKKLKPEILALNAELKIISQEEEFFRFVLEGKPKPLARSILILSDGKAGHLNQSQAVAKIAQQTIANQSAGGERPDIKVLQVEFKNGLSKALLSVCSIFSGRHCQDCLGCLRLCLKKESFKQITESCFRLVISAGSSLAAVNLFSGYYHNAGKIILMKPPFYSLSRFDLVIAPEHDQLKNKANILITRIAPNLIDSEYLAAQSSALIQRLQNNIKDKSAQALTGTGLKIGVLVGGDTAKYKMSVQLIKQVITQLKQVSQELDALVLITTSRRTPAPVEQALKEAFDGFTRCALLVIANQTNYSEGVGGILGLSDVVVVSGESISMVSEAVSSRRHVLVFKPDKKKNICTKQDSFLQRLEQEDIVRLVKPQDLAIILRQTLQTRPVLKKIQDQELIYQAVSRLV